MNIIPIAKLKTYNYSVNVINALKQFWKASNSYTCIGSPKEKNMLLYLDGCSAQYSQKDGKCLTAESGNIIYTPINCEYSVKFYDFKTPSSNTIGINLFLYDETNTPFVLSDNIEIYVPDNENYRLLFSKANSCSNLINPNYGKMKSAAYDILSSLSDYYLPDSFGIYNIIAPGIIAIDKDGGENLYIKEIADLCNISENYFRKLFKEYSGMSPTEYILQKKIHHAKTLLKYDNISAAEIAERLGFGDPSYFTKKFKKYTKMTPTEYRGKK